MSQMYLVEDFDQTIQLIFLDILYIFHLIKRICFFSEKKTLFLYVENLSQNVLVSI